MRTLIIAAVAALAFAGAADASGNGSGKVPQTAQTLQAVHADGASPCLYCRKTTKVHPRPHRP